MSYSKSPRTQKKAVIADSPNWILSTDSNTTNLTNPSGFTFSYTIDSKDLNLDETDSTIPLTIFGTKLGALETLAQFLHDERSMGWTTIGHLLQRSPKTMFASYHNAVRKQSTRLLDAQQPAGRKYPQDLVPDDASKQIVTTRSTELSYASPLIPLAIFRKLDRGPLESLVLYLVSQGLSCTRIAQLLHRHPQTIFTTLHRARRKQDRSESGVL